MATSQYAGCLLLTTAFKDLQESWKPRLKCYSEHSLHVQWSPDMFLFKAGWFLLWGCSWLASRQDFWFNGIPMSIKEHSMFLPYPTPELCTTVCVCACTKQSRNSPSQYSELKCHNFSIASRNLPKPSKQQKVWSCLQFLWWKPRQKDMVYRDPAEWFMTQIIKLDSKLTWRSGLHSRVPSAASPNR